MYTPGKRIASERYCFIQSGLLLDFSFSIPTPKCDVASIHLKGPTSVFWLGFGPRASWCLAQFISAGSTLPSSSRTGFSRLECAVQTGRGARDPSPLPQLWESVFCAGGIQRHCGSKQLKRKGTCGHRSLKEGHKSRGTCVCQGGCLQTERTARGGVTSFLPPSTKKDGRHARRVVTTDSPPAAVRGPIRVSPPPPTSPSPSGGTRLLHPHAVARAV